MKLRTLASCLSLILLTIASVAQTAEIKDPAVSGGVADGKVRLVIEGILGSQSGDKDKLIFSTALQHSIKATRDKLTHQLNVTLDILQGDPKELPLTISGEGEIKKVTGEALQDWSNRQEANGTRTLILRPKKGDKPLTQLVVTIVAERELKSWKNPLATLVLTPPQPVLFSGFVKVETTPDLDIQPDAPTGLLPVEAKYLPEALRGEIKPDEPEVLAFQFHGSAYTLPLKLTVADPETRQVVLRDFKLAGTLAEQNAAFVLTATAHVTNPKGGSLSLLSGGIALTELAPHPDWRIVSNGGRFILVFDKAGDFPLSFKFNAAVKPADGWNAIDFHVAPSALQPIVLQGLPADTQFQFAGAARPERTDNDFASFLPPDGTVKLSWKTAAHETEGKLFYAAEMLSQVSVAPGLMRQVALFDCKVMQGELGSITLLLRGAGEVTRVQGDQVLAWKVEPGANADERRLVVQFNQPQKNQFGFQVQTQTPIGAFPQTVNAMQLRPEGATRFAGYFRIVNEGAVRLEIAESKGLSQISPDQFPESDATQAAFREAGEQKFAYRFSGADFTLRIQADQILPELTVSEVLAYQLGENELAIDAEIEIDVREAPLRELLIRVPRGYTIAKLNAQGLSDHNLRDLEEPDAAELQLLYAQPVMGRQVVQLRLERNQALGAADWVLPRIEVSKAKSVRGHIAVTADAGFRLTAGRTQSLTDIATAFFPRKVTGIQAAFRLSEAAWQATMHVERLPQSIQVDAFHLFSIGEGIAYGSSVLNYAVSGAPIATFKIELSKEYYNVEFTGKEVRDSQKLEDGSGYIVRLHTPVSGAYTLLATYERPFKPQGETLAFTGARPLDAQSEQGHTLVISAYQFQVKPVNVSPGLLPLETAEVPSEYRLFFDAPILAAYHYTARPFNLSLALSPLAQGDSLSQVVDRATLITRISKEGQVLTNVNYFVKNRGNAHFPVTLPAGTELWSATVNGATVVPVKSGDANLIPLPQQKDPNAVLNIALKLAERSKSPTRVKIVTPTVAAPVMLAEWKLQPDTAQRLDFRDGTLTPVGGIPDVSGFAQLARTFSGRRAVDAWLSLLAVVALIALAAFVWRGATREGVYKFSARYWLGLLIGCAALLFAGVSLVSLGEITARHATELPREITFLAPVQQAGTALSVEVGNVSDEVSPWRWIAWAWPVGFALLAWAYAWLVREAVWKIVGWTLLAWAALRFPNGAGAFLLVAALYAFWQIIAPALRRLWQVPRRPKPVTPPPLATGVTAALLLVLCIHTASAQDPAALLPKEPPVAETVTQEVRVEEAFALATAKVHWQALKGQRLPLLFEPAVLTKTTYPNNALKLVTASAGGKRAQHLLALESGAFDIELQYQVPVTKKEVESGIVLPAQFGLVNRLTLTLANLDVDVVSPQAVSVERKTAGKDTVATLVLAPANEIWIGWKPRSRDVAREKAVFYAELTQLYIPTAGVIEGLHEASIRPAQGELGEMTFTVPKGTTVTDVLDAATCGPEEEGKPRPASIVSQWRFDPDTGKLRVNLNPPQSRPFALIVRSQIATGPLPVTQSVGLIAVDNAANQIGLLGMATGSEVKLDTVTADTLSPLNLEDFPEDLTSMLEDEIPGLTVHNAFRYADVKATASLKASAVEPDVRVQSQDTLSLGEDRVLLAVNATVDITRAGIFRLSFLLPAGMDIESIAGEAMSHWTEAKTDGGRMITIHLRERTEGEQKFAINLAGPGLKTAKDWAAPQLIFREANKQQGTFLVVPEQGMRLQIAKKDEGISQLDPKRSGVKQKGVLAFRVSKTPWSLSLDIERVDPWVQVTSLQHATVGEAFIKVVANLQYQIENAGLKAFRVALPANAENVHFQGEQVADFIKTANAQEEMAPWDVKLHRRVIGQYLLQVTYQVPLPANAAETKLLPVNALDINLQRGFVTVQSGGRLQVRVESLPPSLQPAEWQAIPRTLQKDLTASSASFAYRLVDPNFRLTMKLERHEATKLLPARVKNITFTSVISDNGAMLTQVRLEIIPGDKRLLHLTLPKNAKFWFAFVNQNGVWPWREEDQILIPLEQQSRSGQAIPVSLFYSSQIGDAGTSSLDLQLHAPKFDLPLEDITWQVYLNEKWKLKKWTGSLQLQHEEVVSRTAVDVQTYLQSEVTQRQEKTKVAEEMLNRGNTQLQQGNPQEARRAFETAWKLSQHDNAFNEDARVQLHNLKLQQAIVGLNVGNSAVAGETDALAGKLREGRGGKDANYTQQDAKQILDRNTADDNAAFNKLAERIIQQQDAAVSNPASIQANIPEQGRLITFSRSVAVDNWADLQIGLEAKAATSAGWFKRLVILLGIAIVFAVALRAGQAFRRSEVSA